MGLTQYRVEGEDEFRDHQDRAFDRAPDPPEETKRFLLPVTSETVRIDVPWSWLDHDAGSWHVDPGFPDARGREREGYLKAPYRHPADEHDPHTIIRVRCFRAPKDCWDQEPDPETGYKPPHHRYAGYPVWSVSPAIDAHGMPWWILTCEDNETA